MKQLISTGVAFLLVSLSPIYSNCSMNSKTFVNKEVYEQISSKTKSWTAIEPEKSIFYDKTDSEIK